MGSSAFENSFNQMNENIENLNLEASNNSYNLLLKDEIKGKESNSIRNYILDSLDKDLEPNSTIKNEILRDITNIEPKDKNYFLFLSYYEYKLVTSLDKLEIDIIEKIENAKIIMNHLSLKKYKSLLNNKIAEFYFLIIKQETNKLENIKNKNTSSYDKIKNYLRLCLKHSDSNDNNKKTYLEFEEEIDKKINKIYIKELIDKENFEMAEKIALKLIKIKTVDDQERDEINTYLSICYEKLGLIQQDYNEAKKYFLKIIDEYKKNELLFRLNEKMINKCIEKNNLKESIIYFMEIFKIPIEKNDDFINVYNNYFDVIMKIFIKNYKDKKFFNLYKDIFVSKNIIFNDIMKNISIFNSELLYFKDHVIDDSYEYIKKNLLNEDCSSLKKIIYINLIPIFIHNKNEKIEIFKILIKSEKNLNLIIKENIELLIDCFKNNKNLDEIIYLSKILSKIFISKNNSVEKQYLYITIEKIKELLLVKLEDDILIDSLEQIIYLFYEMSTRYQKIDKYDLQKIEQILWKINEEKVNLRYAINKEFLFLSQKNYILNINILESLISDFMNEADSKILDILILQFKLASDIIENYLPNIFDILINYFNNSIIQSRMLLFLWDVVTPELLSNREFIEKIEDYYEKIRDKNDENKNLFYKILQKIPYEYRGTKINEILKNKDNINLNININNFKNNIFNKEKISLNDLRYIENNLNEPEIVDSLISFLKKQNELFQILDLEKISKIFYIKNKELFELIIDKELQFNEKSLINLLDGFYRDKENDFNETFKIFKKIKSYQHSFPEIIEINLNIEKKLKNIDYSNEIDKNDIDYIFYNLDNLKGFSNQHIKFIAYIFDNYDVLEEKEILNKDLIISQLTKLLIENSFNIGTENFKNFLKILPKQNFISIYYKILYEKQFQIGIKEEIYHHLYILLEKEKDEEIIFNFIDKIKYFIDYVLIPKYLLEIFILFIKKDISNRITTEIIYFLGNYFSIDKEFQNSFLDEIISIKKSDELFQKVLQNAKDINEKNKIFYLYSSLNYLKFNYYEDNFEHIYEVPKVVIINIINKLNNNHNKKLLIENIEYFENYFGYQSFAPDRDIILRKLYFNEKGNDYEKLKDICYDIE